MNRDIEMEKSFLKQMFGIDYEEVKEDLEKEYKKALKMLDKYKRKAFVPSIKESENTFSDQSKFGGYPYLRTKDDWPKCPNCHKNMQLYLQLNLQELPEKKEEGLIQLFYCDTERNEISWCEHVLNAYDSFSKGSVSRKIEVNGESAIIEPVIDELINEKLIIDWTAIDDYPHHHEYDVLGIEMEHKDILTRIMELRGVGLPLRKDKLFGWPYWWQYEEYPSDPKTGKQMELLFQLDPEDNLSLIKGWLGYLTQSPDNDEELTFGWSR